jgi:hypothetical protein
MSIPEQSPRLPIPPALMVSEPGSFAQYTIRERLPTIIQRTIADNSFSQSAVTQLEALTEELSEGVIRPIGEDGGADVAAWSTYAKPFEGHSWLNIPFYFAEAYFYRRILEAIAYFQASPAQRIDPFAPQKQQSLEMAATAIRAISPPKPPTLDASLPNGQPLNLIRLLHLALWGNRVDLSLWSARESSRIRTEVEQDEVNILINHSHAIAEQLSQTRNGRFDFIVDNAGFELVCDLVLVDFLLSTQIAETIHLHLKPHPLFVSDAMIQDVHHTLAVLAVDGDGKVRSLADRVRSFITCGSLHLRDDYFWTAPLPFWEMQPSLRQELAQSQRVFVKGDANYRRLLGDCHWAFTTPLEDVVSYFPASLLALRTLKSEVIVGLDTTQVDRLNREDPQWLINGQWGVIHSVDKTFQA